MTRISPRLRALILSLLVVTFASGAFAGVAGGRMIGPTRELRLKVPDMASLYDQLELTEAQRREAARIMEARAPRSEAVVREFAARLHAIADSADAELRAILSPDQQRRLDSLRTGRRIMLKRKVFTPTGARVDTLIDSARTLAPR